MNAKKLIIWVACNLHRRPQPGLCSRCATAQDMNNRQAVDLLAESAHSG